MQFNTRVYNVYIRGPQKQNLVPLCPLVMEIIRSHIFLLVYYSAKPEMIPSNIHFFRFDVK